MDDPSHPEQNPQIPGSLPQPPEQPQSISQTYKALTLEMVLSSQSQDHPLPQASQTSLPLEEKKEGMWTRVKKAMTASQSSKGSGSKISSTASRQKKGMTPIQEVSISTQSQTQESTSVEMTLRRIAENLALGPPPQLPPVQLPQTPMMEELRQVAEESGRGSLWCGTPTQVGSSPGKKLLWPEYQPKPQGPRTPPFHGPLPFPLKWSSVSGTPLSHTTWILTPILLVEVPPPTNSPESLLSPRQLHQERSPLLSPSISDHGLMSTMRSSSPTSTFELPRSPQKEQPKWTEQERTAHAPKIPSGGPYEISSTSPSSQTPRMTRHKEESEPQSFDSMKHFKEQMTKAFSSTSDTGSRMRSPMKTALTSPSGEGGVTSGKDDNENAGSQGGKPEQVDSGMPRRLPNSTIATEVLRFCALSYLIGSIVISLC
ncbi:uncharacterized protein EV420DRAFT_1643472 [Desarmillaria tabescens]|uniref:Uncharacterized protein n=1 Tax=Armillaria tabescens TaxID=1929756 RepID=A0AA39N507_ARMTA|nr:uncharacterized protein EV420DRAFT_1643472 [Desarmillaria tabescens]KAK0458132.1 hypothetical protein EV420DRAFT_1643472 [Desarmillaria tabescens]